jgi:hypothetical protein
MISHRSPFSLLAILLPTLSLIKAEDTESGPLADVTIYTELSYSTARACAAGCIWYSGVWACGYNAGYYDLNMELGCGCDAINACYCSKGLGSSATSYIQSCVSTECSGVGNWEDEVTSMLNLYDGYCKTANQEVASASATSAADSSAPTSSSTTRSGISTSPTATTGGKANEVTASATSTSTTSTSATSKPDADEGLSKSDIVALAASLGVGIPSLLIGAIALWIQLKKKKNEGVTADGSPDVPSNGSEHKILHTYSQQAQGQRGYWT